MADSGVFGFRSNSRKKEEERDRVALLSVAIDAWKIDSLIVMKVKEKDEEEVGLLVGG